MNKTVIPLRSREGLSAYEAGRLHRRLRDLTAEVMRARQDVRLLRDALEAEIRNSQRFHAMLLAERVAKIGRVNNAGPGQPERVAPDPEEVQS